MYPTVFNGINVYWLVLFSGTPEFVAGAIVVDFNHFHGGYGGNVVHYVAPRLVHDVLGLAWTRFADRPGAGGWGIGRTPSPSMSWTVLVCT